MNNEQMNNKAHEPRSEHTKRDIPQPFKITVLFCYTANKQKLIMKRYLFLILALFLAFGSRAQQDPKAKTVLDDVAAKFKAYKAVKVEFQYIINNQRKNYKDTIPGTFFTKGDKYKLFFMGNEVFYNGNTLVTLMPEANEANITKPPKDSKSIVNPAELFSVYKKDFKYSYREKFSDAQTHVVDLYPDNVSEKKYSRIRVNIAKSDNRLLSVKKFDKSGTNYTLSIQKMDSDVTLNNKLFDFQKASYPGVEIVDLR